MELRQLGLTLFLLLIVLLQTAHVVRTDWCPSEVMLEDGEEFLFSSKKMASEIRPSELVSRLAYCEMRIRPKFYDSSIIVSVGIIDQWVSDLNITITGFDPTDPMEVPLKTLRKGYNSITNFDHMALKINAQVTYLFIYEHLFEIIFRLHKESECDSKTIYVGAESQYIVSPNYPEPFPEGHMYCVWHFEASEEIQFELVEYDGHCSYNHLAITFDDMCRSPAKICGTARNQLFYCQATYFKTWHTATVNFYSVRNPGNRKGFMLRYRLRQTSSKDDAYDGNQDSSPNSSSSKTGVAVGSTIASILFVLMVGGAVAVFVTRQRRRQQHSRHVNRQDVM
ncbi:hypothetical protein EGW08_010094 [Elysia chlorotica]|uniref:CUB domain-containing protein n=1 Tax=Elysia chlorotica TaxID=188477 RepID=A0A3S0ZT50_ELYCH|nr:hypothetical protein EGW08_010094 [Elysia chlorotica]